MYNLRHEYSYSSLGYFDLYLYCVTSRYRVFIKCLSITNLVNGDLWCKACMTKPVVGLLRNYSWTPSELQMGYFGTTVGLLRNYSWDTSDYTATVVDPSESSSAQQAIVAWSRTFCVGCASSVLCVNLKVPGVNDFSPILNNLHSKISIRPVFRVNCAHNE